jgi:hypothetical protein
MRAGSIAVSTARRNTMKPKRRNGKTSDKRSMKDLTPRRTVDVKAGAEITAPRDPSTGLPTGKRMHGAIRVV